MALAVDNGFSVAPAAMRRLMTPFPGRAEFALRLALCCTMTSLVVLYYGTPEAALTTYLVFFLNKPDRISSAITVVATMVLITGIIGLLLLLANVVLTYPAWRVLAMATLSFGVLFLSSASKLKPVGGTLALVTAYALDALGSAPFSELVTRGLLYTWLCVAIPSVVSVIVSLMLAPSPRRLAERALAHRLEVSAAALRLPTSERAAQVRALLRAGNETITGRLKLARIEDKSRGEELAALARVADATLAVLGALAFMRLGDQAVIPAHANMPLADLMDRHADTLRQGAVPSICEMPTERMPADGTVAADVHAALLSALAFEAKQETTAAPPATAAGSFLQLDAFTNPVHTRYAIKTTAAAMACYLLYSLTDWPGIHTCMITCYIVSLGTLSESVRKLSLRIAGCLAGAAIGLLAMIFVMPHVTTLTPYLLLLFVGVLPATWVAAGGERVSYAGFQIAFAFFLCVIQGKGPGLDMVVARDRVIGILIGISVVYLVSSCVWPVSVRARLTATMVDLDRLISLLSRATNREQGRSLAIQTRAVQVAAASDIELAHLEPDWVRPDAAWLAICSEVVARSDEVVLALAVRAEVQTHASEALLSFARERIEAMQNAPLPLPIPPEKPLGSS